MATYTVAVRALCEFCARRGDLDTRFTPAPTAREGVDGHRLVAGRRAAGHRAEVPLSAEHGALTVRGRADGVDLARGRVEEVKTHRGRLERQPPNQRALHWAQARIYGWLVCRAHGLAEIDVALVYLDVGTREETVLVERCDARDLRRHFEACCDAFVAWAERELAHRAARADALGRLAFPHAGFRAGQRALAESVWRAARGGGALLAQAPTGSGKTLATLFPLLKAVGAGRLDRVFFVTAKTSGRAAALAALETIGCGALRTLELVARAKACEHPGAACHGEACELARGFHDRLPAARVAALALPRWDRDAVRAVALDHRVCPYWLGQELARWSDVVVGDYNHWFDAGGVLHGLAQSQEGRVGLLVDEAHNLVARAREMYSATLEQAALHRLRRDVPARLRPDLDRLARCWAALNREQPGDHAVLAAPPAKLLAAIERCQASVGDHLAEDPAHPDLALLDFHFATLQLTRLAADFGPHSLFDLTRAGRTTTLALRNVVPAPFVGPRIAAAVTAILFSATLRPEAYYRDMLGLAAATASVDVASPFDSRQLEVRVAGAISTRWRHRERTLDLVVRRIADQYDARPGNYLAFFGGYDYMEQVAARFAAARADVPVWRQVRAMTEAEQAAFIARFAAGGRGIGFAVLGGAFAEGIDLPGERLVGAFIATLGLPRVDAVNEAMRRRLDAAYGGAGFDYVYLVPGLQRVVQAAGRVIRTPADEGVVHLLDDRYAQPRIQRLLPHWWNMRRVG